MLSICRRVAATFVFLVGSTFAHADEILTYTLQGTTRTAILHVPAAAVAQAAPLVIAMYGSGDSAANFQKTSGLDAVADREIFIVVYPEAIDARWSYSQRWPKTRMPLVNGQPADDIGFFRAIIDDLVARKIVDEKRVYASGFSRGALMSFTLACALHDKIAAIAAVGSPMTSVQIDECQPGHSMPVMMVNGTSDDTQFYDGFLWQDGRLLSVPETLDYWRRVDGCTGEEDRKQLPQMNEHDRTRTSLFNWTGCKAGTGVRFYRIENGGHRWPRLVDSGNTDPIKGVRFGGRSGDIETAVEVWGFLKQYQR